MRLVDLHPLRARLPDLQLPAVLAAWALFAAADTFRPWMAAGFACLALAWLLPFGRSANSPRASHAYADHQPRVANWRGGLQALMRGPRRTPLDGAMAVFALTGLLGVATAYDRAIALRQFGLLL